MIPLVRFVRRFVLGAPVIVVSGLPRSGTSMMMAMLGAGGLGLVSDGRRLADEDNPNGYFELEQVKDLGRGADKRWLKQARGKGVKVISTLLKELPRTLNYKVILMRRNLDEVLASQARMLAKRGEVPRADDAKMRQLFENDLWRAEYLLKHDHRFEYLPVDYAQIVERPDEAARGIAEFLGGGLDVESMAAVVDNTLYRNRVDHC